MITKFIAALVAATVLFAEPALACGDWDWHTFFKLDGQLIDVTLPPPHQTAEPFASAPFTVKGGQRGSIELFYYGIVKVTYGGWVQKGHSYAIYRCMGSPNYVVWDNLLLSFITGDVEQDVRRKIGVTINP
ncbi:MAG: hypothetical protein Q7S47_00650 [bacterium]|nr:hypothetical protein [bacterium]